MNKKEVLRLKRHKRIRQRVSGTKEMPRLVVRRSLNNLSAQAIDDVNNRVLAACSTSDKDLKAKIPSGGNIKASNVLGETLSAELKSKGIERIVFDRAGYLYHGRIKAFADSLRKGGIKF
ncbi:MAG: 50S ribosomal protein L18 [Candidatus Omnitrophica bacterium]|jgi:large subunit ribosomal protein L18|nr:50S ribosomal protein L18 [Candidatus Omnitrophota bacterium]